MLTKAVSLGAFPHHRSRYYLQAGELACFCIPLNLKTQLITELRWYYRTLLFPDPCSLLLGRFLFTSKFVDEPESVRSLAADNEIKSHCRTCPDLKGSRGKNLVPSFSFIKSPILLFVCFFRESRNLLAAPGHPTPINTAKAGHSDLPSIFLLLYKH
jgi:hypothetical protein